jgi:hypothetical protein
MTDESKQRKRENTQRWRENNREKSREYNRKWRQRNPEFDRDKNLKRLYGISREQLNALVSAAKNTCPVCRHKLNNEDHRVCVDHCHNTGVIRGVICLKCNSAEGLLGSPEVALRLYEYMKKNELFYQGVN